MEIRKVSVSQKNWDSLCDYGSFDDFYPRFFFFRGPLPGSKSSQFFFPFSPWCHDFFFFYKDFRDDILDTLGKDEGSRRNFGALSRIIPAHNQCRICTIACLWVSRLIVAVSLFFRYKITTSAHWSRPVSLFGTTLLWSCHVAIQIQSFNLTW